MALTVHLKISHSWYDFVILLSEKISYTLKMEIDEIDGNDGHIYSLKKMMKYRKY